MYSQEWALHQKSSFTSVYAQGSKLVQGGDDISLLSRSVARDDLLGREPSPVAPMEALRRSPAYAEGQIRLLLSDLKSSNHTVRVKAVKHFQDYIVNYGPEIYDDDVDFLFTGTSEAVKTGMGLLYFSGLDSDKHDGQLKRIAAPAIALIAWLISLEIEEDETNVFYERFVQLPVAELVKINFAKHISIDGGGARSKAAMRAQHARVLAGQTRSGSSADALRLLSVLMRDHRAIDGEPDPVDLNALLDGDKASKQIVDNWLSKSANEDVAKALEHFRGLKVRLRPAWEEPVCLRLLISRHTNPLFAALHGHPGAPLARLEERVHAVQALTSRHSKPLLLHPRGPQAQALAREVRPTTWAGVVFRPVPLQVRPIPPPI